MLPKLALILLALSLSACGPSRSAWVDSTNNLVGQPIPDLENSPCDVRCRLMLWSPNNHEHRYQRVVEGDGNRYYFNWLFDCNYSVYTTTDGVIRSWRFETLRPESCYVF